MNWPFSLWHNHFHSSQAESFCDFTKLILFKVKSVLDEQPMDIEALHLRFHSFFYFSITSHHSLPSWPMPIIWNNLRTLLYFVISITFRFFYFLRSQSLYFFQLLYKGSPLLLPGAVAKGWRGLPCFLFVAEKWWWFFIRFGKLFWSWILTTLMPGWAWKKGKGLYIVDIAVLFYASFSNVLLCRLVEEKEKGNAAFRVGNYEEALGHYTKVGDNNKIHFLKFWQIHFLKFLQLQALTIDSTHRAISAKLLFNRATAYSK